VANVKILIVDDDPIVLDSCKRVFEAEGLGVCLVSSTGEALEAIKNNVFDILLIDVKMPEQDGMYLMRAVKGQWPELPIVVMSGYPTPETIAEGLQLGAEEFIAKPFTPDELLRIVRRALQKGEGHEDKKSPSD
jgi:DNA-binding NtrC family response regulator